MRRNGRYVSFNPDKSLAQITDVHGEIVAEALYLPEIRLWKLTDKYAQKWPLLGSLRLTHPKGFIEWLNKQPEEQKYVGP